MTAEEEPTPDAENYELQIIPDTQLNFSLERGHSSKCKLTLSHPGGGGKEFVAYKVMTNQPRRYLVKPSHGVIAPGESDTLSVSIVDKYKKELIQTYDRLGSFASNAQQDKFLVQSCVVSKEFAYAFEVHEKQEKSPVEKKDDKKDLSGLFLNVFAPKKKGGSRDQDAEETPEEKDREPIVTKEELASLFKQVFSPKPTSGVPVTTKKLKAVHTLVEASQQSMSPLPGYAETLQEKSKDEVIKEMLALRKKYDELVDFTVTLTTERDALRRKLEHTRRK